MNVAFSALLILVLVLPGIILRHAYARGPRRWSHPTSLRPVADEVAYSIVFAIGLHLLWLRLAAALGQSPDLRLVLVLMTGAYGPDDVFLDPALSSITDNLTKITWYFGSLYAFSALAGLGAHWLVRRTGLDRATRLMRFNNDWYYLLSGEVLQFRELEVPEKKIAGVYFSAVVEHAERAYLYRGVVADFAFDKSGALDRVVLRSAHRRELSADRHGEFEPATEDPRYYDIRGDFFILRDREIKTLNLDYFVIEEGEDPAGGEVVAPSSAGDAVGVPVPAVSGRSQGEVQPPT